MADRAEDMLRNDIHEANWTSLAPHFGRRAPRLLTTKDCRDYANKRFKEGRAPSTVHTELSRLRTCLKWAFKRRLIDVLVDVWVPSPSKPRDRVLTRDELRALLAGARAGDPHVYVFVVLLICTSARHTAILDLTWDRVNFLDRTITYDESRPVDAMSKSWQKGRATVPMPELAFAALQEAFTGRQCAHVVEHGGRRLKSVRTGFARAAERAGIKGKVTPHTIRHTVATLLREGGLSNDRVARILGHNDERTTDLIYTHTGIDFVRDAVGIIDDLDLTRH